MSKAQCDGYKTCTDKGLNEYREKLDKKLVELIDEKETWKKVNDLYILCVQGNEINNQNGSWKWNGWEITGRYYRISVYEESALKFEDGKVIVNGLPVLHHCTEDKEDANKTYQRYVDECRN